MTKNVSYHKVLGEERKDQILILEGNHSYWKKFHAKSDKKQKICLCAPVSKFQKISTLNICDETKLIYPKKQKKIPRRDSLRISVAVVGRFTVNKVSLNNSPPVYLHMLKQILSSELKPL